MTDPLTGVSEVGVPKSVGVLKSFYFLMLEYITCCVFTALHLQEFYLNKFLSLSAVSNTLREQQQRWCEMKNVSKTLKVETPEGTHTHTHVRARSDFYVNETFFRVHPNFGSLFKPAGTV